MRIGFIGLGAMGLPMAGHLVAAGHDVTVASRGRGPIDAAVAQGARQLIDRRYFPADRAGTPYLAPQLLVDVDHSHRIMREETFGPAVGIVSVASDEEAVRLMNDSAFGLTAAGA